MTQNALFTFSRLNYQESDIQMKLLDHVHSKEWIKEGKISD